MRKPHVEHRLEHDGEDDVFLRIGPRELVIRHRYETVSMLNDFVLGFWFLLGSVSFFDPARQALGVWLFVIGSAQLMLRPMIRLANRIHVQPLPRDRWDF